MGLVKDTHQAPLLTPAVEAATPPTRTAVTDRVDRIESASPGGSPTYVYRLDDGDDSGKSDLDITSHVNVMLASEMARIDKKRKSEGLAAMDEAERAGVIARLMQAIMRIIQAFLRALFGQRGAVDGAAPVVDRKETTPNGGDGQVVARGQVALQPSARVSSAQAADRRANMTDSKSSGAAQADADADDGWGPGTSLVNTAPPQRQVVQGESDDDWGSGVSLANAAALRPSRVESPAQSVAKGAVAASPADARTAEVMSEALTHLAEEVATGAATIDLADDVAATPLAQSPEVVSEPLTPAPARIVRNPSGVDQAIRKAISAAATASAAREEMSAALLDLQEQVTRYARFAGGAPGDATTWASLAELAEDAQGDGQERLALAGIDSSQVRRLFDKVSQSMQLISQATVTVYASSIPPIEELSEQQGRDLSTARAIVESMSKQALKPAHEQVRSILSVAKQGQGDGQADAQLDAHPVASRPKLVAVGG